MQPLFTRLLMTTLASLSLCAAPRFALAQSVYAEDMATSPAVNVLRGQEQWGTHRISWTLYGTSPQRLEQVLKQLRAQWQSEAQWLYTLPNDSKTSGARQDLLKTLKNGCRNTAGALNPLDFSLREAWGFTPQSLSYRVPTAQERARLSQQLSQWGCEGIAFSQPLTLDYFAAGWLVDQSKPLLTSKGVSAARLQIDDVAYYAGVPPQAEAWKVPVYHPRKAETLIQYFYLKDQALMMLGDATSHFYVNGVRFPDFVDARTGGVHEESAGAYVLSSSALAAQLLARGSVLLEKEPLKAWVQQSLPGTRLIRWQEQLEQLVPQNFQAAS